MLLQNSCSKPKRGNLRLMEICEKNILFTSHIKKRLSTFSHITPFLNHTVLLYYIAKTFVFSVVIQPGRTNRRSCEKQNLPCYVFSSVRVLYLWRYLFVLPLMSNCLGFFGTHALNLLFTGRNRYIQLYI